MSFLKFLKSRAFAWEDINFFEFEYSTGNMMNASVLFRLRLNEGVYTAQYKKNGVPDDKAESFVVDSEFVNKLTALLKLYRLDKWDGFKKSDKRVLDGYHFHAYIHNTKNQRISASGYMKWPKNYSAVKKALTELYTSL